jgi:hypothetical protein
MKEIDQMQPSMCLENPLMLPLLSITSEMSRSLQDTGPYAESEVDVTLLISKKVQ